MTNAEHQQLNAELDSIIATTPEDVLIKRFFKNFGCINFRTEEFYHELALARLYHERNMKLHPADHCVTESEPYSCYHVTACKCGFKEACDSGD